VREVDVLIVGAGPAGAVTAINLAPFRSVLLIERRAEIAPRIGESLVPAARRLFADMGLLQSFLVEKHEPWYGNLFLWGNAQSEERDFLRDPDGPGWHLDRPSFEQWLRETAKDRGAQLLSPATLVGLARDDDRWQVLLKTANGPMTVKSRVIVDAGGRAAPVARKLGHSPRVDSNLVCFWMSGHDSADGGRGLSYVEAVKDGWWYTAPVPRGRRVLAFHTDADLSSNHRARTRNGILEQLAETKELARLLHRTGFLPQAEVEVASAHSGTLEPVAGKGWLAVGDAALSFDPLSSQGLFNALFTGLMVAESAHNYLEGDQFAVSEYQQTIRNISAAYRQSLASFYAAETRWPEAPFWHRRQATTIRAMSHEPKVETP
jgi:flavin-dependent dehydrogenase